MCAAVFIEFLSETGDLPLIVPDVSGIRNIAPGIQDYSGSFVMNITEYQKGIRVTMVCVALC